MSAKGSFPEAPATGRLVFDGISMRWDSGMPKVLVDSSAQSFYCTADGRPVTDQDESDNKAIPLPNDWYVEVDANVDKMSVITNLESLKDDTSIVQESDISLYNR